LRESRIGREGVLSLAVIDGGTAAIGLYVRLIIGKYGEHLPPYRLEQIAARARGILSRSALPDRFAFAATQKRATTDRAITVR